MKVPGEAVLEFSITPQGPNRVEIRELSRFLPRGLAGILYWAKRLPPAQLHFRRPARRPGSENLPPHPLRSRTLHAQTAPGLPAGPEVKNK